MELNLETPLNSLSFGQVGYGILNELYNRNIFPNLFPRMGQVDIKVFDKATDRFKQQLQIGLNKAPAVFKKNCPYLNIWHIHGGSWSRISEPSFLLTFHELDSITDSERNILNSYNKIFVASKFTKEVFENNGVTSKVVFVPLGIDKTQYFKVNKPFLSKQATVWSIIGKFENRKHTKKAIQGWLKLYSGNPLHRLHLFVNNPFFAPEAMNQIFADVFDNKALPSNVILFGHQPSNSLMNDAFNATDIIIDMSGGEGLSLPSLTCLALGKHGVIHNCSAMKDWANNDNAVLVEPSNKIPAYDGVFFHPNQPFNQGNIYEWNMEDYLVGLQSAYSRWLLNRDNTNGTKLYEEYSFENGVPTIINEINNI